MSIKGYNLVLLLFMLVGLSVYVFWPRLSGSFEMPDFAQEITSGLDGWAWEDLPLANSPELLEKIDEELTFDAAIFRVYQKADLVVAVYAAYWFPGKKDYRSIYTHVPDVCWRSNGWSVSSRNDDYSLITEEGPLEPGQHRTMEKGGRQEDVLFWLVVNGVPFRYSNGTVLENLLADMLRGVSVPTDGHYFLRISANQRMEELRYDQDFLEIVEGIAQYGLYR